MAHGPIRTALINILGGLADHQVEAAIVAALPTQTVLGTPVATSATVAIAVYATGSKILRKIIIPDFDGQLDIHHPKLESGESSLTVPIANIKLDDAKTAIQQATGTAPPSDRCAVVDPVTSLVVGNLGADPAIDTLPGYALVLSDTAKDGDKYDPKTGKFSRLFASYNLSTNTIDAIGSQPIDNVLTPTGFLVLEATGLKVGQMIPLTKVPK